MFRHINYDKYEKIKELAYKEAKLLKEHSTKKERGKLNYKTLSPSNSQGCIYGQMTSDCKSDRAVELINKCCTEVVSTYDYMKLVKRDIVNSVSIREDIKDRDWDFISPIEAYIMIESERNEKDKLVKLINYIKEDD